MSKTKINDPGAHHAGSGALIRRFLPYLAKYKMTLFLDLFCAALTTLWMWASLTRKSALSSTRTSSPAACASVWSLPLRWPAAPRS